MLWIALLFLGLLVVAWAVVTQPTPGRSVGPGPVSVDPARLEKHVRGLAEDLSPRDAGHPSNLDRVAAYIRREFEGLGEAAEITEQVFTVNGEAYRNVIARLGPETGERIVVGAHYDAAGPYPGADDNASGVAGLIELAHLLGGAPTLHRRVEIVAFALEEPPYFATEQMGSAVHAATLHRQGVAVRAMFCLEMIGFFTDAANSQSFPTPALKPFYPSRGNFIVLAATPRQASLIRRAKRAMRGASPLPVYSISAPASLPGIDFSDHRNYWRAGYPAVMITDSAFYRNKNYHTAGDRPETLDYRRMAMVVQGVYAAVVAEANAATR